MASEFAKLNRTLTAVDLDQAWQDRLDDAIELEKAGRYAAAIATRLYALEIYLKFRMCQRLNLTHPLKKLEIHDLDALVIFAGFSLALDALPASGNIRQNWDNIEALSHSLNDFRYLPASRWSPKQCADFSRWLFDPSDGFLTWLKTQK